MPRAGRKKTKTPARRKKPAALAPRTGKAEPEQARVNGLTLPARAAGVKVTEDTALTLGALFACVRVITESLAGLPWLVHRARADGGLDPFREHPVTWLLDTQASPEMPAFQFRETIVAHALTWGNGYAEIERDGAGRPVWLWLLTPDRVTPQRDLGRIVYEIANPRDAPTFLEADDVFHLRGLGFDGLVGYSVIQLAARSIGAGIALDQATADFFGEDSTPGGLLAHPGRLSDPARKNLQTSWEARHKGPLNRRRVAILEEGMTWEQTGLPPEDSNLIEQRQFTPADICRWFRVPPHKIGDLARATFSNIEHQSIEFVNDTLRPWAERLETEADIKLFGRTNRGTLTTVLNLDELKRGDMAAQAAFAEKMLLWGVFSINEARAFLNRNPIGPDGDKRFVQQNMQLLEKAGEGPEPPPVPPAPDQPPPGDGDGEEEGDEPPANGNGKPPEPMRLALRPVFEDACRRILRRESQLAGPALKLADADRQAWLVRFRQTHGEFFGNTLRPAASALVLSRGGKPDSIEAALSVVAERHLDNFAERLALTVRDPGILPLGVPAWEPLASEHAERFIEQLSAAAEVTSHADANAAR